MNKFKFVLSTIVLSGGLLSCTSSDEIDSGHTEYVNMLSNPEPIELTQEQRLFAYDNNGFTLNFLKSVNNADKSGKSFIYSPLSITYVLGMVNDAATGQTEQELEQALGFRQGGIKAVNDYCKKLIDGLPKVDNKVTLKIANALFVNQDKATLKAQYQKDVKQYYDAKAENLNFKSASSLKTINGWVNDHTNGMIPKILDRIDENVLTYLLNAVYFKADWSSKFDPKNTKNESFTTSMDAIQLPLMHQEVLIQYNRNDIYSAIEMPYGNGYWTMTVMLPEEGKSTDDIINSLSADGLRGGAYRPHEVDLKLPRFETSSDTDELEGGLISLLQGMGIHLVFNSDFAEIPNMCEDSNLYISMMRQKAKIKVNEEGSEAAAVTVAATYEATSVGPVEYPKATFHANRPFVYAISEASSGVILFVGKFTGK